MANMATPTIKNQANGSFAENKNEIDNYKIAESYHEGISNQVEPENHIKISKNIFKLHDQYWPFM